MPSTETMAIVAILFFVIVLVIVAVFLFGERKKITQIVMHNADDDIYPVIAFPVAAHTPLFDDQTFDTTFGKVFMSSDEERVKAATKVAVAVHVMDGPSTFAPTPVGAGGAANFKIYNRTSHSIQVGGGRVGNGLNTQLTDFTYKHFSGFVEAVTVPAHGSRTTVFTVASLSDPVVVSAPPFKYQLNLSATKAPATEN